MLARALKRPVSMGRCGLRPLQRGEGGREGAMRTGAGCVRALGGGSSISVRALTERARGPQRAVTRGRGQCDTERSCSTASLGPRNPRKHPTTRGRRPVSSYGFWLFCFFRNSPVSALFRPLPTSGDFPHAPLSRGITWDPQLDSPCERVAFASRSSSSSRTRARQPASTRCSMCAPATRSSPTRSTGTCR